MGSSNEVKKAPVEITAKVTDTFEALIAAKKVIQCKAMIIPAKEKPKRVMVLKRSFVFRSFKKTKISPAAMIILYHTSGMASMEISAPKTAVNPHIKTIKCRWR